MVRDFVVSLQRSRIAPLDEGQRNDGEQRLKANFHWQGGVR